MRLTPICAGVKLDELILKLLRREAGSLHFTHQLQRQFAIPPDGQRGIQVRGFGNGNVHHVALAQNNHLGVTGRFGCRTLRGGVNWRRGILVCRAAGQSQSQNESQGTESKRCQELFLHAQMIQIKFHGGFQVAKGFNQSCLK